MNKTTSQNSYSFFRINSEGFTFSPDQSEPLTFNIWTMMITMMTMLVFGVPHIH